MDTPFWSHRKTRFALPGLLCLLLNTAAAQRLPFFNLGIEDGLVQSQATALTQDRTGVLWIGTLGGLTRYDGRSLTNYTIRDGLPATDVTGVLAHPDGLLYVATTAGVARFDGRSFQRLSHRLAGVLQTLPDGTAGCLMAGRPYRLTDTGPQVLPTKTAGPLSAFLILAEGLWTASPGEAVVRLRRPDGATSTYPLPLEGQASPLVRRLVRDRQGRLWALTNAGPLVLRHERFSFPETTPAIRHWPAVSALAAAPDSSLWFATSRGVWHLAGDHIRHYGQHEGLSDNRFLDAICDLEGNLWLASDGQGVFRFSGAPFAALDGNIGLPSPQIMALATNGRGTLYLGTYDAGLFAYQSGRIRPVPLAPGTQPAITALACMPGGVLWAGTRNSGLYQLHGTEVTHYTTATPGVVSDAISSLHPDPSGRLWVGFAAGASVWDGHRFSPVLASAATVYDFLPLGGDSMLLATSDALLLARGGQVRRFLTGTLVDSSRIQCLARQGDTLWMGSSDNGVIGYDQHRHRGFAINRRNGLRSEFIYNLLLDGSGAVWAGTGRGIHRIRAGRAGFRVDYFGKNQGVPGLESNLNAALALPDGSLWFGTTGGVAVFRPGAQTVRPRPVTLVLDRVLAFGEPITDTTRFRSRDPWTGVPQGLRLPFRQANLTFSFHAVSLSGTDSLYYRYRIDGLEAPWSDWGYTSTVTFSALPPGKLVLRIQGGTDGHTALQELTYPFEIETPFYRTVAFRLLVLAACVGIGIALQYAAGQRRRRRELLIQNLRREEQAHVRQRTAEDFHDEVGNTLTRINVLTNVLKAKAGGTMPDALPLITQIQENTGRLYSGTRDILWSLQPSNDSLYEILHRIRDTGAALFEGTETAFAFSGTDEAWRRSRMPLDASRNLTMIFKEALNNALKYARASQVKVQAVVSGGIATLHLQDDGIGFDAGASNRGHGLTNMQTRARRLGGTLTLLSAPGGTSITLRFPVDAGVARTGPELPL